MLNVLNEIASIFNTSFEFLVYKGSWSQSVNILITFAFLMRGYVICN